MANKNLKILVAGGTGLVGSAVIRKLQERGYSNITGTCHSRKPEEFKDVQFKKVDLLNQKEVQKLYEELQPDWVFVAAAKVGGIIANSTYRGQFLYENLQMQNNLIHEAYKAGIPKLMFFGSSCIYPKNAHQPMNEDELLTDLPEYTNEPYAIAKIAGLKMCENYNLQYGTNFISVMPTNLYGPNDNYHLEKSHVLAAIIRKVHLAKCLEEDNWEEIRKDLNRRPINSVDGNSPQKDILNELASQGIFQEHPVRLQLWGTGKPRREFLHSDDLADACVYLMEKLDFKDILANDYGIKDLGLPVKEEVRNTHINIGTGTDISIRELADMIKDIIEFNGEIHWDHSKPDGMYQKLLDVSKLHSYGWHEKIDFRESIEQLYADYRR